MVLIELARVIVQEREREAGVILRVRALLRRDGDIEARRPEPSGMRRRIAALLLAR